MNSLAGPLSSIKAGLSVSEFPDQLSPILVRELRRALRGKNFAGGFLALQIFSLLAALLEWTISVMLKELGGAVVFPGLFNFLTTLVFQLLLPLAFFNSLQAELGGRNVELLLTSRLSPWQIVRGKWFAASTLGGLFLVSLLPYFLVRYFLGGVELLALLSSLLDLFLHNALMNAIVIGASAFSGPAVRVLVILYLMAASSIFMNRVSAGFPFGGISSFHEIAVGTATLGLFTILSLQLGKSKLNPQGNPDSPVGSVMTVVLILLALVQQWAARVWGGPGPVPSPVALTIILVCALALDRRTTFNKRWCFPRPLP